MAGISAFLSHHQGSFLLQRTRMKTEIHSQKLRREGDILKYSALDEMSSLKPSPQGSRNPTEEEVERKLKPEEVEETKKKGILNTRRLAPQ